MQLAQDKFEAREEKGVWGQLSDEQAEIVAWKAQLEKSATNQKGIKADQATFKKEKAKKKGKVESNLNPQNLRPNKWKERHIIGVLTTSNMECG